MPFLYLQYDPKQCLKHHYDDKDNDDNNDTYGALTMY